MDPKKTTVTKKSHTQLYPRADSYCEEQLVFNHVITSSTLLLIHKIQDREASGNDPTINFRWKLNLKSGS